ncbi:MAG: 2-C-methyl-D-erythritol 4-phosphate cytidylyltransferase [Planktomarina sp.]
MTDARKIIAVLVAGGRGTRAGSDGPKQWQSLAGKRVADWTVAAFADHADIAGIVVVHHADDRAEAETLPYAPVLAVGGVTRAASVHAGLEACAALSPTHVMIHDMARPCITADVLNRCITALDQGAAAPALTVADALWRGENGKVQHPVDRENLFRAQTPQCFAYADICAAHDTAPASAKDDVEVALAAGLDVTIVAGCENNLKITYPADFARAEQILRHL